MKSLGALILILTSPIILNTILSLCLSIEIQWKLYSEHLFPSLLAIFGFLTLEIILLKYLPGEWSNLNSVQYKLNGFQSFLATLIISLLLWPWLGWLYQNFIWLILTLEWLAFILCIVLYWKDGLKWNIYDFFAGVDCHPSIWGYQLKQIINCRFGMMSWPIIVISCLSWQYYTFGYLSNSILLSSLLQLFYIGKFFWWESQYYHTIDIAYDNFGFYICWGVCVWVPGIYSLVSLYLANRPAELSLIQLIGILILGVLSTWLNYDADNQKTQVRRGLPEIWGSPTKVIRAKYFTAEGEKESLLLISGWWGLSRHFHYLPELMASLAWTLPCGIQDWLPYFYFIYLTILLIHRTYRDEDKCKKKYGRFYQEYMQLVPYRIVPYLY